MFQADTQSIELRSIFNPSATGHPLDGLFALATNHDENGSTWLVVLIVDEISLDELELHLVHRLLLAWF